MNKINSPLKHKEGDAAAHEVGTQWKTEAGWHAANDSPGELTLESMINEHNERLKKEKEEEKIDDPAKESTWDPLKGLSITQEVADKIIPNKVSEEKIEELDLFYEKKKKQTGGISSENGETIISGDAFQRIYEENEKNKVPGFVGYIHDSPYLKSDKFKIDKNGDVFFWGKNWGFGGTFEGRRIDTWEDPDYFKKGFIPDQGWHKIITDPDEANEWYRRDDLNELSDPEKNVAIATSSSREVFEALKNNPEILKHSKGDNTIDDLFSDSLWIGTLDDGGKPIQGNQNSHRQITTKEIKEEDITYAYKVNSKDKTDYDLKRKELNEKKKKLKENGIEWDNDKHANELYNDNFKEEILGDIEESVETYDPNKKEKKKKKKSTPPSIYGKRYDLFGDDYEIGETLVGKGSGKKYTKRKDSWYVEETDLNNIKFRRKVNLDSFYLNQFVQKPLLQEDIVYHEGTLTNPDLYDGDGDLKTVRLRNENRITKEELGTLEYFLKSGDGKYLDNKLKHSYETGERLLTTKQYKQANLSYLEKKKKDDDRFEVEQKYFNPNEVHTYSDEDVSPGNDELEGGFVGDHVPGSTTRVHKYEGWRWQSGPSGGGAYFGPNGEVVALSHANAQTDLLGNSVWEDRENVGAGEYIMYNPFSQTSEERLTQIAIKLDLRDENGEYNGKWIADLQDLDKVFETGGQEGNFIRGKNNVYMINHPQWQFPHYIQFSEKYPEGRFLTIESHPNILKGFYDEWNKSQKNLSTLIPTPEEENLNLKTLKNPFGTNEKIIKTQEQKDKEKTDFIFENLLSDKLPGGIYFDETGQTYEIKGKLEENPHYQDALSTIEWYDGKEGYEYLVKEAQGVVDAMKIQFDNGFSSDIQQFLSYKYIREKHGVSNVGLGNGWNASDEAKRDIVLHFGSIGSYTAYTSSEQYAAHSGGVGGDILNGLNDLKKSIGTDGDDASMSDLYTMKSGDIQTLDFSDELVAQLIKDIGTDKEGMKIWGMLRSGQIDHKTKEALITNSEANLLETFYKETANEVLEGAQEAKKLENQQLALHQDKLALDKTINDFKAKIQDLDLIRDQRTVDIGDKLLSLKTLETEINKLEQSIIYGGDQSMVNDYNSKLREFNKQHDEYSTLIEQFNAVNDEITKLSEADEFKNMLSDEETYNDQILKLKKRYEKLNEKNKILIKKEEDLHAEIGFNATKGVFQNNFQLTDNYYKWLNQNNEDGAINATQDAGLTLVEGIHDIVVGGTVGFGWELGAWVETSILGKNPESATQYSRTDEKSQMMTNYLSGNMVNVAEREKGLAEGGLTFRNILKTGSELAPFVGGVIIAGRKGNVKGIKTQFKNFAKKGGTLKQFKNMKQLRTSWNISAFTFRATFHDYVQEGRDMGLSGGDEFTFGAFASTATALSQLVMPDHKFFGGGKFVETLKKPFIGSLKQAVTTKGKKEVVTTFVKNYIRELGEEELDFAAQSLLKTAYGLNEYVTFNDWEAHKDIAFATLVMAAPLGAYGAHKDYKRFKVEAYDAYFNDNMGPQIIEDLSLQESLTREKLDKLNNQENPPYQQIEELEASLKQLEDGIIYARSIQEASKNAPANVTSDLMDLLVEKQVLIDSKTLKGDMIYSPTELKKINEKIAELDKKIESTEVYDSYVNESKERGEEKIKETYGEDNDIEIVETDDEGSAEEVEIALNEQLILKNEEIRELQQQLKEQKRGKGKRPPDEDATPPLMNTTDIINKRQERNNIKRKINNIKNVKNDVNKKYGLENKRKKINDAFNKYKEENKGSGKTHEQLVQEFQNISEPIIKDGSETFSPKDMIESVLFGEYEINQNEAVDGFFSNGFITAPDVNGRRKIIINKKQALKSGYITTLQHEFLHAVLNDAIGTDPELQASLGAGLLEFMTNNPNFEGGGEMMQRLKGYTGTTQGVEIMPLLSEALTRKDLTVTDGFLGKMKDTYRQWLQRKGMRGITFDTNQDVFNFIKDYNATMKSKKPNIAFQRAVKEGIKGKLINTTDRIVTNSTNNQFSKSLKNTFDQFPDMKPGFDNSTQNKGVVREKGESEKSYSDRLKKWSSKEEYGKSSEFWDGYMEIENSKGLEALIKLDMPSSMNREQMEIFVDKVRQRLLKRYRANFDPSMVNGSLFGWLTGGSGKYTESTLYHTKGKVMEEYTEEVPTKPLPDEDRVPAGEDAGFKTLEEKDMSIQAQAREAREGEPERPKTRREEALEGVRFLDAINISPKIVESIKNVVANIGLKVNDWKLLRGLDYKGIKNLITPVKKIERKGKKVNPTKAADVIPTGPLFEILNMISNEFGVDAKRILANQSLDETQRGAAQTFINEKAQEILDVFPDQHTMSGEATGLTKLILELAYIPGARAEYSAGATAAGLKLYVKNPNFTAENLKTAIGMDATNKGRDGLIKGVIVQAAVGPAKSAIKEYALKDESSPFHAIAVLDDGASQIYFSKNHNNNGIQFANPIMDFAKEQRDWKPIVKARGQTMPDLGNQIGRDELLSWMFNEKGGNLHTKFPLEFFIRSGSFHGTSIASHKDGVTVKEFIKQRNNTSFDLFGKPYNENNLTKSQINKIKKIHPGKTTQRTINHSGNKMLFRNKADAIAKMDAIGAEFAPMDADIKILLKAPKHNESKKDKEARERGLKKMLNILNGLVQEDNANIPYVASMLSSISSLKNHWFRNGAVSDFYNTLDEKNIDEHQQPASDLAKYLFNRMIDRTYDKVVNITLDAYKQGSLPVKYDNALKGDGFSYKNDAGEFRQGILEGKYNVWIRYANPNVNGNPIMVDGKLTGEKGINFNIIILSNGNSVAQEFKVGVNSKLHNNSNIIAKQQDLLFKIFSGQITQAKASTEMKTYVNFSKNTSSPSEVNTAITFSKAINNSRSINHKTPLNGMTTWDFDDTLAITKSGVRATIPNPDGTSQPGRKVIFLAGGAGSGKGNVISKLELEKQGFKIVNQDISLEWLKKNNGLPENMNDLTKEQRSTLGTLQHQARGIAKRKMMKYQGNADGVVVDGTGGSIKAMENLVNEFKDKGYDVSMLFVETSLKTALERNAARKERSLLDKMVERNHQAVQNNKDGFKNMFGDRFMEIKTDNLTQKDAMPETLTSKVNDFVSSYKKVRLDAEEFATQGAEILEQGGEFDFTEFDVVTEGKIGPMFKTAMDRAKKFGTKDTYVLTARPTEAVVPIHEFLKSQGLNIPIENITGLGNSTGEAKAKWMLEKFSEGYNDMFFADDAMQNVEAVRDVLDQLDVKSKVVQAKIQFSKSIDYTTENLLTNPATADMKDISSINKVKNVDRLSSPGVYSSIQFSKKHRSEYENTISKHRPDLVKEGKVSKTVDGMFIFIDSLNIPNDKKRKYERITTKWLATSNVKLIEDRYKITDAVNLSERFKLDLFSYNNPNEIIEAYAGKVKKKLVNPNDINEFGPSKVTNKKHGITEHEVENTKEGQQAVRDIIDSHWGENSNPWCITQAKNGKLTDDAWTNWRGYEDGPKRIIFQDGKLLAFYANGQYWDRMDNATDHAVVQIKKGRVTNKVELLPEAEFVMETRTVSEDKKTVTTEYFVETEEYNPGHKLIEDKANGITTKSTLIRPDGTIQTIKEFKNGKEVVSYQFDQAGKVTGVNTYGAPFGDMSTSDIITQKGDMIEHQYNEDGYAYMFAGINLDAQGIARDANTYNIAEIGWKMPVSNSDLKNVIQTVDGKVRIDLKKVLEIDSEVKGLPRKVAGDKSGIQFSRGVNRKFNDILEQATKVESQKTFSEAQAKLRGARGKYRGLVPASAQDFMGLIYNFLPRGKKGDEAMDFFKKALIDPFARGINEINTARQSSANDYRKLRKKFPKVRKKLNKKVGETGFTNDQAVRVYLWNKAGFEIPGLSKRDLASLNEHVKNDPELQAFADALGLISKKEEGYSKPGEHWLVENIASDLLSDGAIGDARSEFLAEWQQNSDQIFSNENLNKIEAIYGSKFREALEDMLYRMRTGKNRPTGSSRLMNAYMNWVNQSIGAIMFFNIRSAALQTISATNYINWTDNNPLKAAAAFANQKQFWKDFVYIFNSDYLKQRRSGNRRGVNETELSAAIANSDNKVKAALSWLLSKGFLPTQIADSFAIASGGATFYRNRVKTYEKTMPKAEAEAKAWLDFQERTEVAQQSARPDLISQQQANPLGRLILAFQNTPMQYGRIMNKAFRDLANNRGDKKHHMSKIVYYGGLQAIVFGALQSAIFAALGDDDEEEFDTKKERIVNQMISSWLSVFGYGGRAVDTLKSTIQEYKKQKSKEWNADHAYTLLRLLSFSPPIGSKLRKIYSSIQTDKYNEEVFGKMGPRIDNPIWNAVGNVVEGFTNIPLGRISQKLLNIDNAMDPSNDWYKRVALLMGWNTWDLGIKDPDVVEVKEEIKEEKKVERKKKEKIKKKEKKIKKEKEEINLENENKKKQEQEKKEGKKDIKCAAISKKGVRCKTTIEPGSSYCTIHIKVEQSESGKETQCKGIKSDKKRCKMMTNSKSGYCYYHD